MKVKELIAELKDLDQELEVTDGNAMLIDLIVLRSYYDGAYSKIEFKENDKVECRLISSGYKVKLEFMHWEDILLDNPQNIITYENDGRDYGKIIELYREKMINLHKKVNEKHKEK